MSVAIKVENLSKAYHLGQIGTGTISNDLARWYANIRGTEDPFLKVGETNVRDSIGTSNIVWSLKDINFEIQQGEAVGIIGRNGAGKSTLLKILSKITAPTTGKISGRGRIASLLEVGTGFHPELSGRENIFLNGAILGMRKKEIQHKLQEIIDFSGIERYIDTPVKRYSSGMYVRLAFAVAAYLESEILIVDEVLAVGDAEFQKKCLGKMNEVSKGEGRTVLFVSHNMSAIQKLCKKAILLENGHITFNGQTDKAIEKYIKITKASKSIYEIPIPLTIDEIHAYAHQLRIEDLNGELLKEIPVGLPWQIVVEFIVNKPTSHFIIAIGINNSLETNVRTSWSEEQYMQAGRYTAIFQQNDLILATDTYYVTVGLSSYERSIQYLENIATFTVSDALYSGLDKTIIRTTGTGIILNPMRIKILRN
ncbi:ATP-binding cassette domain-containing protein [Pedobacter frigidisoli]|uniref:ATP-binding cassette domain-containing protein n=1 Tax=Pedobacter frigidisoli TaxID=2530455 RepID=A0A4R0NMX6_9SPHI|nr:polysaccharide ABC transporter ATP-binding protein [Pedobacter frigidisoli]TCD02201.1 ATP-binding cassette domain-containing protein [Pedobacter frigidisoli]